MQAENITNVLLTNPRRSKGSGFGRVLGTAWDGTPGTLSDVRWGNLKTPEGCVFAGQPWDGPEILCHSLTLLPQLPKPPSAPYPAKPPTTRCGARQPHAGIQTPRHVSKFGRPSRMKAVKCLVKMR